MAEPARYVGPTERLAEGDRPRRLLAAALRLALLLLFEAGALAALVGLDRERWRVDWADFWTWLQTSPVEDAVVGLLRWVGIVIVGWLLASSALYALARLARVPALLRGAQWVTLPVVRGLVERALAVTVAASTVVGGRGVVWAETVLPPHVRTVGAATPVVDAAGAQSHPPDRPTLCPPEGPGAAPASAAMPAEGEAAGSAGVTEVEVRHGDHLWALATAHLAAATGTTEDQLEPVTIAPYWLQVVEANRSRLRSGHPGLIFPGERVLLPPVIAPPEAPSTPPVVEPAPPPPVAPEPTAPAAAATPDAAPVGVDGAPTTAPPAGQSRPATDQGIGTPGTAGGEDSASRPSRRGPSLAERIGLTGASAVLAAGVLQVLRRLRRRRQPSGASPSRRPPPAAVHLDLALRTTEGLDDVAWTALVLRELGAALRPRPGQPCPAPRLVELGPEGLEVLWEQPRPEPAEGWLTVDGGWSWRRPRSAEPARLPGALAPCPLLVTIGRRDGRAVLVNLEAVGTLSICGPGARDVARSMCLELGTTPFAELTTVVLCGFPVDGVEHLSGVVSTDPAGGLVWLRDRAASTRQQLDRLRLPSAFAARAAASQSDPLEAVVVVAGGDRVGGDELDGLVGSADPRCGAAAVVVDPGGAAGTWCLRVDGGRAVLEPLGLELEVVAVSPPVASQLAVLLDDAAGGEDPLSVPEAGPDQEGEVLAGVVADLRDPSGAALDRDGDAGYADPPFDVEVKVLGQVEVLGAAQPLTAADLELLAYLATHRNGDTADTIITMLYPEGTSPKTFHNRITLLRRKLGRGSDGELLVPLVTDGRYRLSRLVVTDWDRFLARIRRADLEPSGEAIELLRQALEMVTGPPFRAREGYSWAHSEGATSEMEDAVKAAALRLAELYLDARDPAGSLWAARRGQLVIDTLADAQTLVAAKMEAHVQLGNAAAAVAAFQELLADLAEVDPGLEPDAKVVEVYRAISGSSPRAR